MGRASERISNESDGAAAPMRGGKRKSQGLTATFVRQTKTPGRYGDGHGLYLLVDPTGSARWVLRIQANGKRRDVGLGSATTVTLAEARGLAHDVRRKVQTGADPIAARRAQREGVPTFEELAKKVHAARVKTWRNGKHTAQWISTLEAYAYPKIGKRQVNQIETGDVLAVLLPIWAEKPETARRVLQRVRAVLDHATAAGLRSGENPCRLAAIGLPKQGDTVTHFAALPYSAVPEFVPKLRAAESAEIVRLALEFLILTAARSGEVRGANWSEFDLDAKLWSVPAERMKAGREHVVPLCGRAVEIVKRARELASPNAGLVFASNRSSDGGLSDMAFLQVLRRLKVRATAHGFRSSFRDWVSEETDFSGEVAEMALAHSIGSKVEAAYRRGKLLEKRRELMDAWASYVLEGGS